MDTVLVTGGTGHLGRDIVTLLKPTHQVRILARSPGSDPGVQWARGDLATGEGIFEAVHGMDVIVHAATSSPAARRGYPLPRDAWHSPPDVDVDGTMWLLEGAASAGVSHFVYLSITGVDQPRGAYLRLKHTAEELVSSGDVSWSILRSTQFHWLLDRMFGKLTALPFLALPSGVRAEPVATRDFAEHVRQRVVNGPSGRREEFGGPESLPLDELLRQWQRIRGDRTRCASLPVPRRGRDAMTRFLTSHGDDRGQITWAEWLREHPPE